MSTQPVPHALCTSYTDLSTVFTAQTAFHTPCVNTCCSLVWAEKSSPTLPSRPRSNDTSSGKPSGLALPFFFSLLLTLLGCFSHSTLCLWASLLEDEDHFLFLSVTSQKPITKSGLEQRISTLLLINRPRFIDV